MKRITIAYETDIKRSMIVEAVGEIKVDNAGYSLVNYKDSSLEQETRFGFKDAAPLGIKGTDIHTGETYSLFFIINTNAIVAYKE